VATTVAKSVSKDIDYDTAEKQAVVHYAAAAHGEASRHGAWVRVLTIEFPDSAGPVARPA
jgi:hypothetical protein